MRYCTALEQAARSLGIITAHHLHIGDSVLLNEREVMLCQNMAGTFVQRARQLSGKPLTEAQAKLLASQGGWSVK